MAGRGKNNQKPLVRFLIQPHLDRDGLWPKAPPTGETWTVEKGQQQRGEWKAEMLLT